MNGSTRIVDAEASRLALGALWTPGSTNVRAKQGLRPGPSNPGLVAATSPTPDKNITVQAFQGVVTATRGLGEYTVTLDATKTLDLLTANPMGALARNDLIVAQQTDTFYSDGSTAFTVKQVVGTPNSTPSDPSVTGDYIPLARVAFPANASTVQASYITDLRPGWTVAAGGVLPVATQAVRDALTPFPGMVVYRLDRKWEELYDGGAWRVDGPAICANVADLSAITAPTAGQLAVTTDTGTVWVRRGSSWVQNVGIIARGKRTTAPAAAGTGANSPANAVKITELDVPVVAGRIYKVVAPDVGVYSAAAGSVQLQITYTTDGSTPLPSSAVLTTNQKETPASSVVVTATIEGTYVAGATGTLKVLLSYYSSGSQTYNVYAAASWPCEFWVEDMGADPGTGASTQF
jgi:hypothetical protein